MSSENKRDTLLNHNEVIFLCFPLAVHDLEGQSCSVESLVTGIVVFNICSLVLSSYISPKYIKSPDLYTKKGLPRKQENRRRSPLTPPPSGPIPQIILDILVGTLLGDSHGSIPTGGVNPVFEFKQSIIHSSYLIYMYAIFHDYGYSNASFPIAYFTGDGKGGRHQFMRFRTIANNVFMTLFLSFYPTGVGKVLPTNIFELLTPRALAF